MAPPILMSLPTEVLIHICTLLYDWDPTSPRAFSLASKRCFATALPVLVDTITFNVNKPAQLAVDVEKCKHLLWQQGLDLFPYVRRLIIIGQMKSPYRDTHHGGTNPNLEDTSDSESEEHGGNVRNRPPGLVTLPKEPKRPSWHFSLPAIADWENTYVRLHDFQFGSHHGRGAIPLEVKGYVGEADPDDAPPSAAYESDHHWQPLADLMSQLPGLADVVYRCPSQFPPCLLKAMDPAVRRNTPRLHMQTFKLRSAYDDSATIDPHEWDIVSSPCLHSIWLEYGIPKTVSPRQVPSRQFDTVRWMVKHGPISPCLREVRMEHDWNAEKGTLHALPGDPNFHIVRSFWAPAMPWNPAKFFNQEEWENARAVPVDKGHLSYVMIDSGVDKDPDTSIFGRGRIEMWDNMIDFSLLRTLYLKDPVSREQIVSLANTNLHLLTTLSLTCEVPKFTEEVTMSSRSDYFQSITAFLSGLPSLRGLQLTAWDHAVQIFSFDNPRLVDSNQRPGGPRSHPKPTELPDLRGALHPLLVLPPPHRSLHPA